MNEILVKAALSGVVAGVGSNLLFGDGQVSMLGMSTRASVLTAGAVGVGSVASDMISEKVIENMNIPTNVKSLEETLVRTGVCGAGASAVMLASGMPSSNVVPAFGLGAASKLGGDYLEEKFFGKKGIVGPMF